MNTEALNNAATIARGLAMDAVHACSSGHLGLPLGTAEIGAVLFGHALSYNPEQPRWLNRDRFILSAGHGSMFIYSWLHLAGYNISLEDLKNFRKMGSKTPGHPEFPEAEENLAPGIECTTGPLGQGVANGVGMAMSQKMAAAHFNTEEHKIFDNHIVVLAGDGCLQEGVAAEASSFAGHFGLDNLILIYDSNDVTLDALAEETQSEDTALRYQAYGFDVVTIDGHNMEEFLNAFETAKEANNGKPKLIIAKTLIGKGIPQVAGTAAAHGEGGAKYVNDVREELGLPAEHFFVSDEVKSYFAEHKQKQLENYNQWQKTFDAWKAANPVKADTLQTFLNKDVPADLLDQIPEADSSKAVATRASGGEVLNFVAQKLPYLISGSADLHGSTKNYLNGLGDYNRQNHTGRNIRFGIREHAMGAICNGFAYDNIFLASGATFATFSDYMRPPVRLAALSHLRTFQIWTHDSIGVGEDGPTHQPVEITSALRLIPNLDVLRPADSEETAAAIVHAVTRKNGPTGLILSRQNLPNLKEIPVKTRREGTLKGAYVAIKEEGELKAIILSSGSELQHAVRAAKQLGSGIRVVSVPSMEIFNRQSDEYKESVLPSSCRKRVAIEAGVTPLWYKYVGLDGKVIGVDRFGTSAPGDEVMEKLGITAQSVIDAVNSL